MIKAFDIRVLAVMLGLSLLPDFGLAQFQFEPREPLPVSRAPEYFTVGNLNGDAKDDLVVVSPRDKEITVLFGGATGFTTSAVRRFGRSLFKAAVGDLDGDGIDDIVVPDDAENGVWIIYSNGDNTLADPVFIEIGNDPRAAVIVDGDNDGDNDISVVDRGDLKIYSLSNQGGGAFVASFFSADTPTTPGSILVSSFNGDAFSRSRGVEPARLGVAGYCRLPRRRQFPVWWNFAQFRRWR